MHSPSVAARFAIGLILTFVPVAAADSISASEARPDLESPYHLYELKLRTFCPMPNRAAGVLLPVRINGGRPLRMVLDSGAEFIVMGTKNARAAGLCATSDMDLVGLGNRLAQVGRADTVEIGPLSFRHCRVAFVKGRVIEGADGVIPLSLFSDFLLRLDLPGEKLELIPFPLKESPATLPARAIAKHDLLLVQSVLNGKQTGYVVMDTGAYCSGISRQAARTLSEPHVVSELLLTAGTGATTGQRISTPVHFAIAGQDLIPHEVVALDLSDLIRHCGVNVLGVVGFPDLRNYILNIDYRNHRVGIEPPSNTANSAMHGRPHPEAPQARAFH